MRSPTRFLAAWFFVVIVVAGHVMASETSFSDEACVPVNEEWTEWRGGASQGQSEVSAPTAWSQSENLRWVCELPGRGTSSPIVKDDLAILTASYLAKQASQIRDTLSFAVLTLVGMTMVLGLRVMVQATDKNQADWKRLRIGSFASMLTLLVTLVTFGPSILDFDRCPIRAWLGGSLILSLALLLALACCDHQSVFRLILGSIGIVLSVMALEWLPSKSHAFRNGWTGSSSWVVLVVCCCPLLIGAISILCSLICRYPSWQRAFRVLFVGSAVMYVVADLILGSGIVSTPIDPDHPDGMPNGILYVPTVAWMSVSLVWTVHAVILLLLDANHIKVTSVRSGWQRAILPIGIAAMSALVTAAAVYVLTTQGLYLPYHLAIHRIEPVLGWRLSFMVCGFSLAGFAIVASQRPFTSFVKTFHLFQICVLMLGVTAFASENLPQQEQLLTRAIVAVDRATGEIRWKCEALNTPEGPLHRYNSAASATPLIRDGKVFAWFGSGGVICCDDHGQLLWTNEKITFESAYGAGASPAIAEGVMVIVSGMPENGYVCGLDCDAGTELWRRPMLGEAVSGNSRTPIIEQVNGQAVVLVWGFTGLSGLNVKTGDEVFRYDIGNGGGDQVATLVRHERTICCVGSTETTVLSLDQINGNSKPPIAWRRSVQAANCASPVVVDGLAFCVTDTGVASCLNLKTGKTHWRQRLPGSYYASPIICGDCVYFTNLDGTTSVIDAAMKYHLVSENHLPGQFLASPAPVDGQIYLRSDDRLYCIGQSTRSNGADVIVRNDDESNLP